MENNLEKTILLWGSVGSWVLKIRGLQKEDHEV